MGPRLPLLRAMLSELNGKKIMVFREAHEMFLLGRLSVMDALLNVRMVDMLAEIPGRSGTSERLAHSVRRIGVHEEFLLDL